MTNKDIKDAREQFEFDLQKGKEKARSKGINYSVFKEKLKSYKPYLKTINEEDDYVFDYQSYLTAIGRGKFQSVEDWSNEYYVK